MGPSQMSETNLESIDIREKGRGADGRRIALDRRLFMQFLGFGGCTDITPLIDKLESEDVPAVLYEDLNDPAGIALLFYSETPEFFLNQVRPLVNSAPFQELNPKPEYTMLGRTYAIGYEEDLEQALILRPIEKVCNPDMPWAIWYPLRRSGAFEHLDAADQRVRAAAAGGDLLAARHRRAAGDGGGADLRHVGHGLPGPAAAAGDPGRARL